MEQIEILKVSAGFLNTYGYVGVALLLFGCAYFFYTRRYMPGFWVTGTLGLTFLVIFGALDIITKNFPQLIITRAPLLVGRVVGVDQETRVNLLSGDAIGQRPFVRRENDPDDIRLANHRFIFAKHNFDCVLVALTPPRGAGQQAPPEALYYVMRSRPPQGTRIGVEDELYVRFSGAAPAATARWLRQDATPIAAVDVTPIAGVDKSPCTETGDAAHRTGWLRHLFGAAPAQAQAGVPPPAEVQRLPPDTLGKLLSSEDPFVRRQARINLGAAGPAASSTLIDLLRTDSYRLQLGAVEAINSMTPDARRALPGDIWQLVAPLAASGDPTLRDSALRALKDR